MDNGEHTTSGTHGHAGGILAKGHIATVMQTGFHEPVLTSTGKYPLGGSLLTRQTGNAQLDLSRRFVDLTLAQLEELALQMIDLPQTGPGTIVIEHLTSLEGPDFESSMSVGNLFGGKKIGADFAKAGLRLLRSKQTINRLIELRLVLFDG